MVARVVPRVNALVIGEKRWWLNYKKDLHRFVIVRISFLIRKSAEMNCSIYWLILTVDTIIIIIEESFSRLLK